MHASPRRRPQEPLGGVPGGLEDAVARRQRLLGQLAIGDVGEHALPAAGAVGRVHEDRVVVHPHRAAVPADDAVLDVVVLTGLVRADRLRDHPVAVVGVDHAHPHLRVGDALGGGVAGESLVLRAHVHGGGDLVDRVDVDHGGQLFHERAEALLGDLEGAFGILALGHVLDQALPDRRLVAAAHHGRRVVHPDDGAVGPHEPVLGVEGLAGRIGAPGFGDDLGSIVLVDAGLPEARRCPDLGREPREVEHERRHVVDPVALDAVTHIAAVGDRRQLLHERAIALLGSLEGLLHARAPRSRRTSPRGIAGGPRRRRAWPRRGPRPRRPPAVAMRYSATNRRSAATASVHAESTRARSSRCTCRLHSSGSSSHWSAVKPSSRSIWGLM